MQMKVLKSVVVFVCLLTLANCNDNNQNIKADNSGRNKNDAVQPTAQTQKENDADFKITQKIRQAVVDDDSLSIAGKNAKIITANGFVTLRGPVDTASEKENIGGKAVSVAGVAKVDNQLEVKNP